MLEAETLEKLCNSSPIERIAIIEILLNSLKPEVTDSSIPRPTQRPSFGFMQDTGKILGDTIAPALPETAWDVLQ